MRLNKQLSWQVVCIATLIVWLFGTGSARLYGQKEIHDKGLPGQQGRDQPKPTPTPPPPLPVTPQPPTQLGVRLFGDWPSTGRCDFTLYASVGYQSVPNPVCNDQVSGVDVPFGMSLEICEHDGGSPKGYGKCRRFLPGSSGVGDDMNDKGSVFKVENRMFGYINERDFDSDWDIPIGISYSTPAGLLGPIQPMPGRISARTWIDEDYSIPLPSTCPHPVVVELTKNNQAEWDSDLKNNLLHVHLSARKKPMFGEGNWVGIEIVCR